MAALVTAGLIGFSVPATTVLVLNGLVDPAADVEGLAIVAGLGLPLVDLTVVLEAAVAVKESM